MLLFILFASLTFAMMKYVDFRGAFRQPSEHSIGTAEQRHLPPHCGRPGSLTTTCLSGGLEHKPATAKAQRARVAINGCAEAKRPDQGLEQPDYDALARDQAGFGCLKQSTSDNQLAGPNQAGRPSQVRLGECDGSLPRRWAKAHAELYTPLYLQGANHPAPGGGALLLDQPAELASLLLTGQASAGDSSTARQLFVPVSGDQPARLGAHKLHSQSRHLHLTDAQGGAGAHGPPADRRSSAIVFSMPPHSNQPAHYDDQRQTWQSSGQVIDGLDASARTGELLASFRPPRSAAYLLEALSLTGSPIPPRPLPPHPDRALGAGQLEASGLCDGRTEAHKWQ